MREHVLGRWIGQIIGGPSLARDTGAAPGIAGGTPQLAAAIRSAPHLSSALRGGSVGKGTSTAGTTTGSSGSGSQGTGTSHHHGGGTTTGPSSVITPTTPTAGKPQNPVGALLGKVVGLVSGTVGNVTGALAKVLGKVKLPPAGTASVGTTKSLPGL